MEDIEKRIIAANRAYNLGTPTLSDEAFDTLLSSLPEEHPLRGYLGVRGESAHQHTPKMLSLSKAKLVEDVKGFTQTHEADTMYVTPKLDGVACRLIYVNHKFVAAYTRGDGSFGEDISKVVARLASVPEESPYPKVDGELTLSKEAFERLKSITPYTIARNAVVGLISKNDVGAAAEAGVQFLAYTAHATKKQNAPDSSVARLRELSEAGFSVAPVYYKGPASDLGGLALRTLQIQAQTDKIDTDGIVIRLDSVTAYKALGETSHHPNGARALKHPNDNVTTTATGVRWQVGRSGAITPVIELVPVVAEGAEISRATLHNMRSFVEFAPGAGSVVELKRSGGVIPYIVSVEASSEPFQIPAVCPSCSGEVADDGVALRCVAAAEAPEDCTEAAVSAMCHFAATIGIDGVGPAIAEALIRDGATRGPDLYLAAKNGRLVDLCGEKIGQSLTEEIQAKLELPLSIIIEACGFDRLGKTHAKTIASKCPHNTPTEVLAYFDSLAWADGFGAVDAARMKAGYQRRRSVFALALRRITIKPMTTSGALRGRAFCFTGEIDISRTQAEGYVEELGGICQSGVSKKTDFLVCGDSEASSTKYKKARALQEQGHIIRIISGADFRQLLRDARTE
ncbi:DNA ligase (NAD+) [Gammaproteobacteria bacterium]